MESLSEVLKKRDHLNDLVNIHTNMDKIFEDCIKDKSNYDYILKDAELSSNYLILKFPTANKEWSDDILRIAMRLCELGSYIAVHSGDKLGHIRIDITDCINFLTTNNPND